MSASRVQNSLTIKSVYCAWIELREMENETGTEGKGEGGGGEQREGGIALDCVGECCCGMCNSSSHARCASIRLLMLALPPASGTSHVAMLQCCNFAAATVSQSIPMPSNAIQLVQLWLDKSIVIPA